MPDPNMILTRPELFDLVWTKPATHLAKEFGVHPAIVLKACKLLDIPRPSTGHWVKVAHGQAIKKPALPPAGPQTPATTSLGALESRRNRILGVAPSPVVVTPAAAVSGSIKWHSAVQKTRSAHRGEGIDPKYGMVHAKREFARLNLAVTRDSLDRALLILNKLAWLLDEQGFSFLPPMKNSPFIRLVDTATDTELTFHLREEIERYERPLKPEEKGKDPIYIWDRWRYKATGRLRLLINEYYPQGVQKSWGDGKNTKLENKLADAAPAFVECAKGKHMHKLERDAEQRRWEEQSRLRELEAARARKEQERRDVLLGAAKNWNVAETLYGFRNACEARLRSTMPDGHLSEIQSEWLSWVDTVARDMNPLTAGFLKRLEQPTTTGPTSEVPQ